MIKDFKGQVKVSDIQAAFDEIVDRINAQIDIYNNAAGLGNIDYTKGSPKLSNAGYTLSIGGLKSVIDAYNGTLIGCKAYRLSDTSALISDGIYFKDGEVYRIDSTVITAEDDWDISDLYYDLDQQTVMFKDGSISSIIEVQTGWTQPTITSNTSCGVFTASYNSQDAFKCTTSEGYTFATAAAHYYGVGVTGTATLTWNLPQTIHCNTISFNLAQGIMLIDLPNATASLDAYVDDEVLSINWGANTITLDRDINKIQIKCTYNNIRALQYTISNLIITGNSNSYAYESGGVITPSDNIIKIAHLNWESGNLILNSIDGFQLEGFKGVKLVSQNRDVDGCGLNNWDTLDTSNSGKFVAYLSPYANFNQSMSGKNYFMGLHVTGCNWDSTGDGNQWERQHFVAAPTSLIYIPKGFTPTDSRIQYGSRNVFNSWLSY